MKAMRVIWMLAAFIGLAGAAAYAAPSPWEQPAAALADQISGILGPGPAHLTVRNLSSIPADGLPSIQRLLAQHLKARGIISSGADSANTIRVTLSQDWQGGLWVAEVGEGAETHVAMVRVDLARGPSSGSNAQDRITLRKQVEWSKYDLAAPASFPPMATRPVLAAFETNAGLTIMNDEGIAIYARSSGAWAFQRQFLFAQRNSLPRDPRGILIPSADGNGFTAMTAGEECVGSYAPQSGPAADPGDGWTVQCHASDDPWPIANKLDANGTPLLSAFYNAARNYFTGVVSPTPGVDLPPFYSAALIPRAAGSAALLVGGIDGKVQLVENGVLKPVAGTRDWGSDFAVLPSSCGGDAQIIASGSGEAAIDSLRAFELAALEAVPASAPLAMDGAVTALFPASDGKSVLAVVRNAVNEYEVDRVTALCN